MHDKKKRLHEEVSLLLGYPDSNQEKQDQNLLCYHYTISQISVFSNLEQAPLVLNCDAKVRTFCDMDKSYPVFF